MTLCSNTIDVFTRTKQSEVAAIRSSLESVKMTCSSLAGEEKSLKSQLTHLEQQLRGDCLIVFGVPLSSRLFQYSFFPSRQRRKNRSRLLARTTDRCQNFWKKQRRRLRMREGARFSSAIWCDLFLPTSSSTRDVLMIQSAELIYQNFIELVKENQECPLCDRGIHGDAQKRMVDQVFFLPPFCWLFLIHSTPSSVDASHHRQRSKVTARE